MAATTKFDIESNNWSLYFQQQLSSISHFAKEGLPRDVLSKLKQPNKLSFIAKLYILAKCLKKRWYIVVEDEKGLSPKEFFELSEGIKRQEQSNTEENAGKLISSGTFVTANKELSDALAALNEISNSAVYNFVIKSRNNIKGENSQAAMYRARMQAIVKMFSNYESNKKRWVAVTGMGIPEWLVLSYFYWSKEEQGSVLYKSYYRQAYQSSPAKIKTSFGLLQQRSFLAKTGSGNGAKFKITPMGREAVDNIMSKYVLNY